MDALNRSYPGIALDDPIKPLLDSMAERDDAMNANVAALAEAIKGVTVLPPDGMARLERSAASGAARSAAVLARAHNLRTLLLYGGAFVACVVLAAGGGFRWGQATAADSIQETEQRLALAFRDGPDAAAGWARLMEQNDIGKAVAQCTGQRTYADATGRKACAVPLWIEPPKRTPPAT